MLNLLVEYATAKGLESELGFTTKTVRWAIQCESDGAYVGVIELGDVSSRTNTGREFARCPDLSQPEMKAAGITKSHFLIDTAQVVALFGKDAGDAKITAKHAYFVALVKKAGSSVPLLGRLALCLEEEATLARIRRDLESQKAMATDKVTFRCGADYPVESAAWHDWWRDFRKGLAPRDDGSSPRSRRAEGPAKMVCFATGDSIVPAVTHPKVRGLTDVGGSSTGCVLIGFDKEAFASYGLEQSVNCAISDSSAAAYRSALDDLIGKHSERLVDTRVAHWFSGNVPDEDDLFSFLVSGAESEELSAQKRAADLLNAIRRGQRPDLARARFHALTLSGAAGRVMVRDWMEGQFDQLAGNVGQWFDDLAIVHRDGGREAPAPKFLAVVGATVRELKEAAPPFVSRMWRVAVCNEAIPAAALSQAVRREVASVLRDDAPNHARMGLIKAYHVRKLRKENRTGMSETTTAYMNENHPSSAYHCGRLMAVLSALQRSALGDVGAGVVQRYYAAASCTPSLVLGRLERTSKFHLNKLDPGLAYWYEGKLAGIWQRLGDSVPKTLSLEDQSLFALGYYQQLADLRTRRDTAS